MSATTGWRIHLEDNSICASMWTKEAGDIVTVKGFASRMEAWMFIAAYFVFLTFAKSDKATRMIQEFTARVTH